MNNYSIAVGGSTGYAGKELLRLLSRHPGARVSAALDSSADPAAASGADFVFLATPPDVSRAWVAALRKAAKPPRVIDLSPAFRADAAAVYGWPEKYRDVIPQASLVANPGCYATAANIALWPLVKAGVIAPGGVICDAKSGASGAGRGLRQDLHFCELEANCKAYHVYEHRHAPEIAAQSGIELATFAFTPHLLPTSRGILATHYVNLIGADAGAALPAIYEAAYRGHPFVRLRGAALPELNDVNYTNYCDLGWKVRADGRQAVIVSCLDNLVKGAAGQAVQNFNLMGGWPETTALG